MSNYKNFIQDFPGRCGEILKSHSEQMKADGLEVTQLLSLASVAITIPFERLRKPTDGVKHPSNDRSIYPKANSTFANLCGKSFIGSRLWPEVDDAWKKGVVNQNQVSGEVEAWVSNCRILSPNCKVRDLLVHIRNSIAHGNIYTKAENKNHIIELIFLNSIDKSGENFHFLFVTVENFKAFLINWIEFLKCINLERTNN